MARWWMGPAIALSGLLFACAWSSRPASLPPPSLPPPGASPEASASASPAPAPPPVPATFARTFDLSSFQRGNIHTHSAFSDGDSTPQAVIEWYRSHRYRFLAITDHNTFTNPAVFRHLERSDFLLLGGEELTMRGAGRQVHVNGICTSRKLGGGRFSSPAEALRLGISRVHKLGGIALVNHPNWKWALSPTDLRDASAELLEIASGHPLVATQGDARHPPHESLWEMALDRGENVMGVAVDDAHQLQSARKNAALPGQAWIEVSAPLEREALCDSMRRGELYSSTGVELSRILVEPHRYTIWPAETSGQLTFLGAGGRVLEEHTIHPGEPIAYEPRGQEGYVRARIENQGRFAWTPAVHLSK